MKAERLPFRISVCTVFLAFSAPLPTATSCESDRHNADYDILRNCLYRVTIVNTKPYYTYEWDSNDIYAASPRVAGFTVDGLNARNSLNNVNYNTDNTLSNFSGLTMYMTAWREGETFFFPCQGTRAPDGSAFRSGQCGNYNNATFPPRKGGNSNLCCKLALECEHSK